MKNKYVQIEDPQNAGVGRTLVPELCQLLTATWDGDLINKCGRDELVRKGLAARSCGYNFITAEGIKALDTLGIIRC